MPWSPPAPASPPRRAWCSSAPLTRSRNPVFRWASERSVNLGAMPRLALFDLDDTLISSKDAFIAWIEELVVAHGVAGDVRAFPENEHSSGPVPRTTPSAAWSTISDCLRTRPSRCAAYQGRMVELLVPYPPCHGRSGGAARRRLADRDRHQRVRRLPVRQDRRCGPARLRGRGVRLRRRGHLGSPRRRSSSWPRSGPERRWRAAGWSATRWPRTSPAATAPACTPPGSTTAARYRRPSPGIRSPSRSSSHTAEAFDLILGRR